MIPIAISLKTLIKIVSGKVFPETENDISISGILTDSRKFTTPENCLFVALVTRRNDGHKYIDELYQKGVRLFMVSAMPENTNVYPDAYFIQVTDTLKAMQAISAHHRRQFNIPVIGITGSNGKTIVKEWLYQLLCENRQVVRSPKSYNSQIGVPFSVLQMKNEHEIGIFEAGISEPDEMSRLENILKPTIGIFTNIGPAHDENFINHAQKVGEKLKLFTKVETLIYCFDHFEIREQIIKTELLKEIKAFRWSRKSDVELRITEEKKQGTQTQISGIYKGKEHSISIPFTDEASIENAIHCWACLLLLGYDQDFIAKGMKNLTPVAMRLELKEGINNCSIINDSYNSDINSLSIALDFLNQQKQHKKRTVILSDILQSGRNEVDLYNQVAQMLKDKHIDRIIGIGPALCRQANRFEMEKHFYTSTEDFLRYFSIASFHNESILVKGARAFEFENINKALQQKAHETVLEINLNALVHNLNYFRSLLQPQTRIMAMVKAFSYGSGSFEIANLLQFHNIDYLAVAYADEGIELRKAGITSPILVMNPEMQSFDSLVKFNLEPEIYSFRVLHQFIEALEQNDFHAISPASIHIKLDTGMHRLGFLPHEIPALIQFLNEKPIVTVKSVFSHLAASDDPKEDDFTLKQIQCFSSACKTLSAGLPYPFLRHILNSAGITRFPQAEFDMVRLGISLYGVATDPNQEGKLQNVSSLKTIISQIKILEPGETVGYNRNWTAQKKSSIAVVPIGYADGLNRKLGNENGKMIVNGKPVPIIGNICMDMCMLDITDIDAKEGDEVIVFGNEYPITQLAADMDTIPYEVLTGVSRRVKRIYYHE